MRWEFAKTKVGRGSHKRVSGARSYSDQDWRPSNTLTLATYSITALRLYEPV